MAHLFYGVQQDGGFVVLTGEVGTGKTTVCRCFLEQLPPDCDVAFILNSKLTQQELLETLCDELDVPCPEGAKSAKPYVDVISRHLLEAHSHGRKTLLIIDEAQNLSPGVLEQIRLLTNLETNRRKLLQIVLVGQPELQQVFALPALRQLSQRVTARYHLRHLEAKETWRYICHRMEVAGCRNQVIPITLIKAIMKHTGGIPRLINVLCDRMLLGAYVQKKHIVTPAILREAVREVFGPKGLEYCADRFRLKLKLGIAASLFVCAGLSFWLGTYGRVPMQALGFTKAIHPLVADTGDEAGGATDALSNDNLDNSQSDSRSNNAANSTMETATRPLAPASSREPYSSRLP
ncbi:MAG: AAA family ATPase, partial [Gammaproteobacteria bacterium]